MDWESMSGFVKGRAYDLVYGWLEELAGMARETKDFVDYAPGC